MKLATAAFALLTAGACGLGCGWYDEHARATDAAASASRDLADSQAETQSVREAFQYLNRFGQAVMVLEARCREAEGSHLAAVEFTFKPSGEPDKARAMCHPRRTGT